MPVNTYKSVSFIVISTFLMFLSRVKLQCTYFYHKHNLRGRTMYLQKQQQEPTIQTVDRIHLSI